MEMDVLIADSISVAVNTAPPVTIGNFSDICIDGNPITLSGGSPLGGSYSGNGVSSGVFNPAQAGPGLTYITYQWADTIGCSGFDSASIRVNPLPTIHTIFDTTICIGDTIILFANGGQSYTWNPGGPGQFIPVSPSVTSTYHVTVTDSNSCVGYDSTRVDVLDYPTLTVSADTAICHGSGLVLYAQSNTGYFVWNNGSQADSLVVLPNSPTVYWVTSSHFGMCEVTDSIQVDVNPLPTVNLGQDTIVLNNCQDSSFLFTAPSGFASYLWQNGTTDTTFQALFFPQLVGTTDYVWLRVEDGNGCFGFDSTVIMYEICTDLSDGLGQQLSMNLYPNPNNGAFRISGEGFNENTGLIEVRDNLGKVVYVERFENQGSMFDQEFHLEGLPAGRYSIQVYSGDQQFIGSFIKQ